MTTFNYLDNYKVKDGAIRTMEIQGFQIPNNGGKLIKFTGKFAGEGNSSFVAAQAKLTSKADIRNIQRGRIDMNRAKEKNKKLKEIFSNYVLTGWENVVDDKGKITEFTPEFCNNFLQKAPEDLFDEICDFFMDEENFTNKALSMDEDEAKDLGNGSENQ